MPLDALVTGRIATLADGASDGFGWVEAIGIRDGRVAFAGSEVYLETRADPLTERIVLEPDQLAIPGLTDAHLHLAEAGIAARHVDLHGAGSLEDGMARIGAAHGRLTDSDAWLEGFGWDVDQWGRWPTADDLERVAPGRRVALWAHDHHGLLVSNAALLSAGLDAATPDPAGGVIRRADDGAPTGVLLEAAARLVTVHIPLDTQAEVETGIVTVARELVSLGVVACHDPGGVTPDPDLTRSFPAYASLTDAGRIPIRVHVSIRDDALETAVARGVRSGQPLGSSPDARARVGWLKLFADGALTSRTAALLEEYEEEAERPLAKDRRRGVWMTEPAQLDELVRRAAGAGIRAQIHAIGDAAVRAALDVLDGVRDSTGGAFGMMPRIEHAQMIPPGDGPRFANAGIAASVQPVHLRTDAHGARRAWGKRAEREAFAWSELVATGAVIAFGTDAPVEPFDPWPGIAIAVARRDASWGSDEGSFGPAEAFTLERALRAACIDPAVSAGETDRGRLTVGQRADLVVLPAAALDEPVEPGGALATVRPAMVLVDGKVVFER